jgi:hypothetical protein
LRRLYDIADNFFKEGTNYVRRGGRTNIRITNIRMYDGKDSRRFEI